MLVFIIAEKTDEDGIWIAHLSLNSEDDDQQEEKIDQETNLGSLGEILIQMGEYNQA
jgi:hypothetical protein